MVYYYAGDWVNGRKHGEGKMHWLDSNEHYMGGWVYDQISGTGKYSYANGVRYEGSFKEGYVYRQLMTKELIASILP